MSEVQLELSDEQREDVRKLLSKFCNKKAEVTKQKNIQKQDAMNIDPDPLELAKAGDTIEWHELTAKTRRYSFVRETRATFVPYILDKIRLSMKELKLLIEGIGMVITSENESLVVCNAVQADPVRIFQLQICTYDEEIAIDTIRYVM
jgi:hypothetical protein